MRSQILGVAALLALGGFFSVCIQADAATIAHWRFEDAPGFLIDSSGNGNDLAVTGTVTQTTIPGSGDASAFPAIVPQTLAVNMKAADFAGISDSLQRATASSLPTTQFTVEAFVNWDDSTNNNEGFSDGIFATRTGSTPGLFFQIRTDGLSGTDPDGELFLTVNNGSNNFIIPSGFSPTQGIDYYMAVAFDMNGTADFYVKDLTTNGPLQTFVLNHSATGTLNASAATIEIGGFGGGNGSFDFDGFLDEIRFSNAALDVSDLLITALPVPIPEPGGFCLLGFGAILMRRKLRRD